MTTLTKLRGTGSFGDLPDLVIHEDSHGSTLEFGVMIEVATGRTREKSMRRRT